MSLNWYGNDQVSNRAQTWTPKTTSWSWSMNRRTWPL